MKDRITWVPSLLTGELIPKKTSVWDLDDEENEERNDRRQASLMETTPYSRPKNYETNIRIFQPPITPGSVLPYPIGYPCHRSTDDKGIRFLRMALVLS